MKNTPLSEPRKRELAWEYSQQYHPGESYLEYAITPHQNYYNTEDKVQFDLLEWGNYADCWNLQVRILDVQNNPVYEDNSVRHCYEPDGIPGRFHSFSMGDDFLEFICDRPGYYRIEVSNGEIFPADILENFVCIDQKPEPEIIQETSFNSNLYYEEFGHGSPLIYLDSFEPVLDYDNCYRYAYWLTEHQKEKIDRYEDYPRYPPWGNQIFPLVDYCTDNGEFVKLVDEKIQWKFDIYNEDNSEIKPLILKYNPVLFSGTGTGLEGEDLENYIREKRKGMDDAFLELGIKGLYPITGESFSFGMPAYSLDEWYVGDPTALDIHILKEEFTRETLIKTDELVRKYVGDEIDIIYSKGGYVSWGSEQN